MTKFLCVGQALCDLYLHPAGPEIFDGRQNHILDSIPVMGGGDANNGSIDLAKIGNEVAIATSLGRDIFGSQVLRLQQEAGVDTRFVTLRDDMPTAVHAILLSSEVTRGNASLPGTAQALRREDIPDEAIAWADHVHIVSVLSHPLLDGEGVASVAREAKRLGKTTSMDLQYDERLWKPEETLSKIEAALPYIDVFLPSFDEATVVTGGLTDPLAMKEFFRKYDLKIFGCKLGAKGVYLTDFDQDVFLPPLYRGEPVDTLGCGDAFCSGFISAYKRGFSLEGCGLIGSAASAKICAVVGCNAGMRPFDELIAHARDFGYDAK